MKWFPFAEVVTDVTSQFRKIQNSDFNDVGKYKIIDQGKGDVAGYTDDHSLVNFDSNPVIIFGDHTKIFKYVDFPIALGADGAKALRVDNEKANTLFVFRYLNSLKLPDAGYSRHFKFLKEVKIPLPPLDDQKRIAHLLGKVEGLIAQRKQHLQQLDTLLKSVFLEMFGIDRITDNNWPKVSLGSKTQIVSGVTKGKRYADQTMREVPYMRVANVQDGHLNLSEIKTIEVSEEEIERYQLRRGDLLLTEGGDPDKLGRGALWNDEIPGCIHQNHIFRVRTTDASINPQFLSTLIGSKYGKSYFLKAAKQTTGIASINSTQLKSFPLIIPPIDLQNQFASVVEKIEGIKSRYQQSLADLETLYGALSQKAFAGELDLLRVPSLVIDR